MANSFSQTLTSTKMTAKTRPSISLFDSKTLMELKQRQRSRSTAMSLSYCDDPAPSVDMSISSGRHPVHSMGKPKRIYQNTYKTEPDRRFEVSTVKTIIEQTLSTLGDTIYESGRCRELCKNLSRLIEERVKQQKYKRYKIVCFVTIGELRNQGLHVVSRCVWDGEKDNFATAAYENSSILAVGTVYGVYMD
ncbi:dynein light chain Tctex-type 5-B-like [Xenia sp. Carnegie-2017]|uniref:dynein light chain Tctex-type 5-B-like n=1 Tax=Xenia sp. Carnegie-2017 TaxID=2897299 RepID=UPI001F045DEE|nr:dynein light chain Tctex-type 5-B-like [Xenia sp. Carnegie-2017]